MKKNHVKAKRFLLYTSILYIFFTKWWWFFTGEITMNFFHVHQALRNVLKRRVVFFYFCA